MMKRCEPVIKAAGELVDNTVTGNGHFPRGVVKIEHVAALQTALRNIETNE
jgi:hypothetical protein